jgi:hypothetical protein
MVFLNILKENSGVIARYVVRLLPVVMNKRTNKCCHVAAAHAHASLSEYYSSQVVPRPLARTECEKARERYCEHLEEQRIDARPVTLYVQDPRLQPFSYMLRCAAQDWTTASCGSRAYRPA